MNTAKDIRECLNFVEIILDEFSEGKCVPNHDMDDLQDEVRQAALYLAQLEDSLWKMYAHSQVCIEAYAENQDNLVIS